MDGIAAEIIYASVGMVLCSHSDADYKDACMTAYNRWLQEFCGGASNRLFGLAQTAILSVDSAIEDFKKAKAMGMVGMMMPGNPVNGEYDQPEFDALWECAVDLDLPICFHILTAKTDKAADAFKDQRGHPLNGFMKIIRAVQDVVGVMTLGGVFERHPKLKMVCAEGDAGWMPHFMYRMDHAVTFNAESGILKGLTKMRNRPWPSSPMSMSITWQPMMVMCA
ncbi:MAG: amidohydrolase family protein, partial [Pseudomonadales bacterium]|nr:amidohydrolase family protein [Pseudomonadales bacterium]